MIPNGIACEIKSLLFIVTEYDAAGVTCKKNHGECAVFSGSLCHLNITEAGIFSQNADIGEAMLPHETGILVVLDEHRKSLIHDFQCCRVNMVKVSMSDYHSIYALQDFCYWHRKLHQWVAKFVSCHWERGKRPLGSQHGIDKKPFASVFDNDCGIAYLSYLHGVTADSRVP